MGSLERLLERSLVEFLALRLVGGVGTVLATRIYWKGNSELAVLRKSKTLLPGAHGNWKVPVPV